MRLDHLRSFVALADELHFTRAAARLGISQPALSIQIKALEEELGAHLATRTRRSVRITVAGEALLQRARRLLAELDDLAAVSQRAERGETGELTVSFAPDVAYGELPEFIHTYLERFAGVQVRLRELWSIEQVAAVHSGDVDIGFVHPPVDDRDLSSRILQTDQFLVALSVDHPLARRRSLSLRDLAGEQWVRLPSPPRAYGRDRALETLRAGGIEPRVVAEVTRLSLLLRLVAAGVGVGVVTSAFRPSEGVVFRRPSEKLKGLDLAAVWTGNAPSPALAKFLSVLDAWRAPATPSELEQMP